MCVVGGHKGNPGGSLAWGLAEWSRVSFVRSTSNSDVGSQDVDTLSGAE